MAAANRKVAAIVLVRPCNDGEKATRFEKVYRPIPTATKKFRLASAVFFR